MFLFAILIGIYSYLILFLGLNNSLYSSDIIFITLGVMLVFFLVRESRLPKLSIIKLDIKDKFITVLLGIMVLINLMGALGPELSFDALWYHLTLPKIFLMDNSIRFLDGGLYYYSVMPKAVEMLYIPSLLFGNEILAKLVHFSFGILSLVALYKLSRLFLNHKYSLLVLIVYYSNLVVAWLSITSYIDLGRTFFEVCAIYFLIIAIQNKEAKSIFKSGIMLGLSVATKVLSIASLPVYIVILIASKVNTKYIALFIMLTLIVPTPWFVFAYVNTGNPVFPFFSDIYPITPTTNVISSIFNFIKNPDPISPIYLIVMPLVFAVYKKFSPIEKYILKYCLLSFIIWLFIPQTGGGRFIAPYLPVFSLLVVLTIKKTEIELIKKISLVSIIFIALISIFYRGFANSKYIPVILGLQNKNDFLANNLNFSFGDFYDIDGAFKKIVKDDKTLVIGGHNLYYLDVPFAHESFVTANENFNYILVINSSLPDKYKGYKLVYKNDVTNVMLYQQKSKL